MHPPCQDGCCSLCLRSSSFRIAALKGESFFVDCITHGTPALTGADFGLRMVQLIEAATESMHRKGETIYLQEEAAS